jgi:hypothetical protein
VIGLAIGGLAYKAAEFLRGTEEDALGVLPGGEVDESPVLQKSVDADDAADVSHECPAAVCGGEVFLYVFAPHADHRVAVVLVEFGVAGGEGEGGVLGVRVEEFGEGFPFDGVDVGEGEPGGEGGEGEVGGGLDDGAGDGESVLFDAEGGALGDEVGCMGTGVRRYMVRMMRLTVKSAWESLAETL